VAGEDARDREHCVSMARLCAPEPPLGVLVSPRPCVTFTA
jgi:hypothetical protein